MPVWHLPIVHRPATASSIQSLNKIDNHRLHTVKPKQIASNHHSTHTDTADPFSQEHSLHKHKYDTLQSQLVSSWYRWQSKVMFCCINKYTSDWVGETSTICFNARQRRVESAGDRGTRLKLARASYVSPPLVRCASKRDRYITELLR